MIRQLLILLISLSTTSFLQAQSDFYDAYPFTEADTLRGQLNQMRSCYDVHFYDLNILIDPNEQFIEGYNDIHYQAVTTFDRMQVDLFQNLQVKKITYEEKKLKYDRKHDAIFIQLPVQEKGSKGKIRIYYEGNPIVAKQAPWDGGFVWNKDSNGKPWVGVACEGDGASLWWPNKDHLSEEPDSMSIKVAVPNDLMCVSNGNLRNTSASKEGFTQYDWFVSYPINNYNVTVNIADYAHFSDVYVADDDSQLALDFYVLQENLTIAKKHFQQVHKTLACFERYFGKYPFWKDGYALVETPYLGMEHQGAIAYGNKYMRGYLGSMIPPNMNWDYIIVHETGHEYWGNSISANDHAEMWIHESFTTYMEALFCECAYSYEEAIGYLAMQRPYIRNQEPILGPMDVNWQHWQGSDHYYKGAWILHTLRHAINNDAIWFDLLKSLHEQNKISNITTQEIIDYVNHCTKQDYSSFFKQYLVYPTLPTLEYKLTEKRKKLIVQYRWKTPVANFDMPILLGKDGAMKQVKPTTRWQEKTFKNIKAKDFRIPTELFLIEVEEIK